jgi:crotonobetainyl-CoA:carnitine CoA-transferase CaiB-like acyl-CoA transferase
MVLRLASHQGWTVPMTGVVPKFSETPGAVRTTGAPLGAHTAEVLTELAGADAAELVELEAAGVISLRQ